ncbi:sensor histidine kinase [Tenacibaculum holothuriorum]|nr:ATP-binding protein [Tenacibaculum holothuriorum]
MENKLFYEVQGKPATWLHFKLNSLQKDKYLCIWNTFLDYSKLYIQFENGKLVEEKEFSLIEKNKFPIGFRSPTWKINKDYSNADVFIKVKDFNTKTNLNLLLLNFEQYNNRLQKENIIIIAQTIFLSLLLLFILILFIAKKELSLLWYALYIVFFLFDFLFHMGVHNQFGILNFPIFQASSQMLVPNIAMFFASLFFINFYSYNKRTKWIQKGFIYFSYYFAIVTIIFGIFFIANKMLFPKEIIIYSARAVIILILIFHILLAIRKVIPYYLAFAFILPIISFFIFVNDEPDFHTSINEVFLFDYLVYIATSIEICLVIYYIIKQLIKNEFLAITLKNENLILRNSFQENILRIQQEERNKLFRNIHDSFGGYLEALKLRLLNKTERTPEQIQEIIGSFDKDYRYLLNNLYSPKINSENFVETLQEFCSKINQATNNIIKSTFKVDNTQLTPNQCFLIYRIISELITNSIKHSKASEINVNVSKTSGSKLEIIVLDDGIGYDQHMIRKNSYGIQNIKYIVSELKGNIFINSPKNKGTSTTINIPI